MIEERCAFVAISEIRTKKYCVDFSSGFLKPTILEYDFLVNLTGFWPTLSSWILVGKLGY